MVIKSWEGKHGETVFEKYDRFLKEIVDDCVDIYIHSRYMVSNERIVELLAGEEMYIKMISRDNSLKLKMLMYRNGVTNKEIMSCEPELFIVTKNSAELMVNYIMIMSDLTGNESDGLAYAAHMLIKGLHK